MKVSKKLSGFVKDTKFEIDELEVYFEIGRSEIRFKRYVIEFVAEVQPLSFSYDSYEEDGSRKDKKKTFVAGKGQLDQFSENLKWLFQNRKISLNKFKLVIPDDDDEESRKKYMDCVVEALRSAENLSSRNVKTSCLSSAEISQILPIFPAKNLEYIEFFECDFAGYEQLVHLEQWKKAERCIKCSELNIPMEFFLQFKRVKVDIEPGEDPTVIRDVRFCLHCLVKADYQNY